MVSAQWKTAHILLEAQHYDLIMLGQQTFFHCETQDTSDDALSVVVKQSPCPVVAVPATLPARQAVLIAYWSRPHSIGFSGGQLSTEDEGQLSP